MSHKEMSQGKINIISEMGVSKLIWGPEPPTSTGCTVC